MQKVLASARFRQYAVVFAINLGGVTLGLAINWPSPALVKLTNDTQTVLHRPLDQDEASWIASIYFLIATLGFLTTGALVDFLGRKYCVLLSYVIKTAAALLFLFASDVWMLTLGRAINGVADGILIAVLPIYSSEVASKEIRGALGVILEIFNAAGGLIMHSVGPFISYFELNLMLLLCIVLTSIPLIFVPESPTFLYSKGRHAESRKVLIFLRGSEALAHEQTKEYAMNKTDEKLSILATFRNKLFLKSLGKSGILLTLNWLIGYTCVMSYLQTILNATQTSIKSEVASAIIGGIQLAASFTTMLATDRFGRKPIMVVTLLGISVGMVGLGTFFQLFRAETEVSGFMNYLPLISLIIFVFFYSAGLGSLLWVIVSELFDDRSRGVGMTSTLLIGSVPAFLTMKYFSAIVDGIGEAATFWVLATMAIILAVFTVFKLPETKGMSFTEIQRVLGSKNKL